MTHLILAAALSASLSAVPAAPAGPASTPMAKGEGKAGAAKAPPKVKPASKEALQDARSSLLGPCTPEMAGAKVKAVSVIDGQAMNAVLEKEKSTQAKADPAALFLVVEYLSGAQTGKDYRQVSTAHHLSTAQAQALVGERMCVFGRP